MLLTVHDSIAFQFPKKYLGQLADFVYLYGEQRVKEKYAWLPVPFKLDLEVGDSYGELCSITDYLKGSGTTTESNEGIVEEEELLNELRDDVYEETGNTDLPGVRDADRSAFSA